MKIQLPYLVIAFMLVLTTNCFANDDNFHQGKELHEKKCTTCHKSEVYSRNDRRVKTMSALETQVDGCMKGAAKAEWSKAQTTSVIDYLNDRYYKF